MFVKLQQEQLPGRAVSHLRILGASVRFELRAFRTTFLGVRRAPSLDALYTLRASLTLSRCPTRNPARRVKASCASGSRSFARTRRSSASSSTSAATAISAAAAADNAAATSIAGTPAALRRLIKFTAVGDCAFDGDADGACDGTRGGAFARKPSGATSVMPR